MKIIAHRCGTNPGVPENSVASARRSLELGADVIELDIRYSRDGVPTVVHDADFGRLCGVGKKVADFTSAELARLRYRGYPDAGPLPFSAFTSAGVAPLLIDFKLGAADVRRFIPALSAADYLDKVVLGVRSVDTLEAARSAARVRTLAFMRERGELQAFVAAGVDIIRLWDAWLDAAAVDEVRAAGRQVWVMSGGQREGGVGITTRERVVEYFDLKVDGFLLNDVAFGVGVARSRG
jgi:glycerophosphoryl diester phosphodiesterase